MVLSRSIPPHSRRATTPFKSNQAKQEACQAILAQVIDPMAGQVATVETVTQIFINLTDVVATYHNTRPGLAPHLATGLFQAFALLSIPEMVAEKIASRRPLFNIEVAGGRITDTPFSWFFFCFAQRLHDSDKAMFERIVKELRNNPNMTLSLWEINHYFPKFFGDLVWQQMPEVDIFA